MWLVFIPSFLIIWWASFILEKPDVSEIIVFEFVTDYREGRAKIMPLPALSYDVGGIWIYNFCLILV